MPQTLCRKYPSYVNQLKYEYKTGYDRADTWFGLTGTIVKTTDGSTEILTAMYSDSKGRLVQKKSTTHWGGFIKEYFNYNFSGQPLKSLTEYYSSSRPFNSCNAECDYLQELYVYEYDHACRFKKTLRNVVAIEDIAYNETGQIQNKKQANMLNTDYTYNIRGWTKTQKEYSTGFEQTLLYQDASTNKLYNGNISSVRYKYSGTPLREYNYHYDQLNRLIMTYKSEQGNNDEEAFTYDKNGNPIVIFSMLSNSVLGLMGLHYRGNQLRALSNEYPGSSPYYTKYPAESSDFAYNANGALIKDTGRDIVAVSYNWLNLPDTIQFGNGNAIYYTYSATGQKLRVKHVTARAGIVVPMGQVYSLNPSQILSTLQTDYVGNTIHENGHLKMVLFPGGYARYALMPNENGLFGCSALNYYYNKDYLGNNRDVIGEDGEIQRTEYGSFGTPYPQDPAISGVQPFKYNGKEFDKMHGLNWYDYGARMYDPVLSRFHTMDPLAEKYYSVSPYAYCLNNPILYADWWGMYSYYATKYVNEKGEVLADTDDGRTDIYVIPDEKVKEFVEKVLEYDDEGKLHDLETTDELNKIGYPLSEMKNKQSPYYPTKTVNYDVAYTSGYSKAYNTVGERNEFWNTLLEIILQLGMGGEQGEGAISSVHRQIGWEDGKKDKKSGKMNKFNPKIKDNKPKIKHSKKKEKKQKNSK